jgi:hypothetical protein
MTAIFTLYYKSITSDLQQQQRPVITLLGIGVNKFGMELGIF